MTYMRAIQITVDDALLSEIDADPETRGDGRSAFLRRAATRYLAEKRAIETREAYRRAYGTTLPDPAEVGPFMEELTWPDE